MAEKRTYSDRVSREVMKEVERDGINIFTPEERNEVVLLEVGRKFMIERNECQVIYINTGKRRMTCIGSELPSLEKTLMVDGQEFFVSYVDSKKKKFTIEPYFGGKDETEVGLRNE